METVTASRMRQALNSLTSANNRAFKWRAVVAEYSMQEFGVDPGDIDCDEFIDSCDGGCGLSGGMTVEEFRKAMVDILE